ncbi:multidrug resistance-like protein [Aureobasidium pullulans]|uniref:Multidrug resistance-like protein n=1 Tax=Aureobasidium pullulans TaxID=5580 RepID=A0AB74JJD8_AURPU|nr:multidrug resistance-like protein [Aureobasidium pullulans]
MNSAVCSPAADSAFGPAVEGCRRSFDFTFAFESYFFSIVPSVLLLCFAPLRLKTLSRIQPKIQANAFKYVKLSVIAVLAILQLTLIGLFADSPQLQAWKPATAASVLSFASSIAVLTLSYMEHSRSLRPSMLLNAYLFITTIFDAATLRTLWLLTPFSPRIRNIFTVAFVIKAVVLLLEARGKRNYVKTEQNKSPEDFSGLYGQALLSWLNGLVWKGARHLLKPEDLYDISEDVASEGLKSKTGPADLKKVIFQLLKWPILVPIVPRLALLALTLCQPLLLKRLLDYLNNSDTESVNIGYGIIGAYLIVYVGLATTSAIYWHRHYRFLSMLRGTLITAVYGKAINLSTVEKDNKASLTLMSTDVERTIRGLIDLHEMWANIFQVAVVTWLIEIELGAACVGPVIIALAATGTTIWFSGYTNSFQLLWIDKVQERIGITSSILGSIKAIKLAGLNARVSNLLRRSRVTELDAANRFRTLSAVSVAIGNVPQLIAPVLTFAIYIGISSKGHHTLDTTRMFTSLALILLASEPLFLLIGGLIELRNHNQARDKTMLAGSDAIVMHNASFGWKEGSPTTIKKISLRVHTSNLVMVTGPVACGKSTLLKGLLGETPLSKGRVELSSSNIAYCEQTAWLMNASIQRNIINFSEFDFEFYSSVIHACDLDSDLEVLQKGDATVVGSKGFALSGGQKQRIALARAVYARCSIIILDDVFSQLDLSTQSIIFERLLGPQGLLRRWKTTVVMTVGASKFFSRADHVVVLSSEGTILDQGTFQELCTRDNKAARYIISAEESAPEQSFTESAYNEDSTKARKVYAKHGDSKTDDKDLDAARQRGDFSIYRYYLACISWTVAAIFLLLQLTYAFLSTFPTIWLKWWADANMQDSGSRYGYHIGVYTMLQVGALALSSAVTWWTFNVMAVKTGIQLHNALAKTVMSAPLAFWSKVDTGSVLTRFSQDVQFLDIQLPPALMIVTTTLLVCIAQVGLIATASAWIAISFPALFAVFYSVQKFYLRTSRQLRYLDLEEKAPVYTQFLETLDGLATIRAFNWSQPSIKHNFEIVDRSQKPNYLTWALKKWLALVLDLVITGIAVLVVGVVVGLRDSSSTGFTGVSLTQIISFTTNVKFLIMFWTQLESSLGAVARIRQFEKDTIAEDQPEETHDPSFDWPSRGSININSLSAKYSPDSERLTLDNITMSIPAGSKVGFCGRTGSGKSSLLLTLFKLLTPGSGNITIDGLDLSIIRRETLRSRLNCIAEEPFMFPSSVRDNLALDSTAITDEQMVSVLRQAGLWEAVEVKGGLDAEMKEVHLSQGSKQLFNIARALLRKDQSKVLIMDEATSSIDTQTDIDIQALIRKEFSSHTIISVAHKLETIVDFDFVGVLDEGKLVEYDNPKTLLKQEGSRFKDLWDER